MARAMIFNDDERLHQRKCASVPLKGEHCFVSCQVRSTVTDGAGGAEKKKLLFVSMFF